MSPRLLPSILILVAMIAAPTLAGVLRPTVKIADQGPKVDLEAIIPKQFGDWRQELQATSLAVNPQQTELLNKIYNQMLSRTYISGTGYRIMLSIAYGGDQSDSMQVHAPEECYPAQGYALWGKVPGVLTTRTGEIPVMRLETSLGQRHEPITYWTTIGDQAISGGLSKKLVEMKYSLTGKIPDGLLFRVSSIDNDTQSAFQQHERFVDELLQSVEPGNLKRLAGISPSHATP